MVRLLRSIYEKNLIVQYLYSSLKLGVAAQRLIYLLLLFFIFLHVAACMWLFVSFFQMDTGRKNNWIELNNMVDFS